jgi:hypothetical protein
MLGGKLQKRLRTRAREVLLLESAEKNAAGCSAEVRDRLRELCSAADRRLDGLAVLRNGDHAVPAVLLTREAIAILISAWLFARGEHGDGPPLPPEEAWKRLRELNEAGNVGPLPPALEQVPELLSAADPTSLDRADTADLTAARHAGDKVVRWLKAQLELRTVRQVKLERRLRLVGFSVTAAILLGGAVAWAVMPSNVARGKPVTTSSQRRGTPSPEGAVDGDHGGTFGFHTRTDPSPWVQIDLEAPYRIREVVVYNRNDGHFDAALPLVLSLSADGTTWEKVAERTKRFTASRPWRAGLDDLEARYVRLSVPRRTFLALSEVEVYGKRK